MMLLTLGFLLLFLDDFSFREVGYWKYSLSFYWGQFVIFISNGISYIEFGASVFGAICLGLHHHVGAFSL